MISFRLPRRIQALRRWSALSQPVSKDDIQIFVAQTFDAPGGELEPWTPPDFVKDPPLVQSLRGEARSFAAHLNGLWPQLGRRVRDALLDEDSGQVCRAHLLR